MAGKFTRIVNGAIRTVQIDGSVALAAGVATATVTFPSTLQTGNTTPNIQTWMTNVTDTTPQFQPMTITSYSATGFTVQWDDPTASANYILNWAVTDGWLA